MAKSGPVNYAESSKYEWLIIVIAVFVLRITPWILSEYWYDEVLTLGDFALDTGGKGIWKSVFRSYPIANNHILSSAVYWCWLRLTGFNFAFEHFTRLPSILFGIGLIFLCVCHWRKWLGGRMANLGGLMLAVSPVFTSYAYQIRGYSMSMFLCGLAISGLLECNRGRHLAGQAALCTASLLLPLVIPSNVLILPVIITALGASCGSWKQFLKSAAGPTLCTIAGGAYYLTIWDQFIQASREPGGWNSAWAVAGNIVLAFAIHGIVLLSALSFRKISMKKNADTDNAIAMRRNEPAPAEGMKPLSPICIAASTAAVIALTLLFSRSSQAPYPRVFLIFLVTFSFALLLACSRHGIGYGSFPLLFAAIIFCGIVTEYITSDITRKMLANGISPNNLLMQYYRGSGELREAAEKIMSSEDMKNFIILTDEYDFPTMRMYVLMHGGNHIQVVTRNTAQKGFLAAMGPDAEKSLAIVAKDRSTAESLLDFTGCVRTGQLVRIAGSGIRGIYVTVPEHIRKQGLKLACH